MTIEETARINVHRLHMMADSVTDAIEAIEDCEWMEAHDVIAYAKKHAIGPEMVEVLDELETFAREMEIQSHNNRGDR